jgi:NAD+ synthase (glutamine-hydrolysing)
MLKIAMAQLNYHVGDFTGNTDLILTSMASASNEGVDLLVLTELAVTGYYPKDLLEEPSFLARADRALQDILHESKKYPELTSVVGTIRGRAAPGKPLHNAVLVIRNGAIVTEYYKQLLPTYGIFDERRHFEPGPDVACTVSVAGKTIGLLICEDIWNDESLDYSVNPFKALDAIRPDLLVSINASPANLGKRELRHELFSAASKRHNLPIVYANQVGGQDEIVFDGASFVVSPTQGVAFESACFKEAFDIVGFDNGEFKSVTADSLPSPRLNDLSSIRRARLQLNMGVSDYTRRNGFKKSVFGCSGGIDSALVAVIAADSMGPENVTAITMPSEWSSEGSVSDSVQLCKNLGIELIVHPIGHLVRAAAEAFEKAFGVPLAGLALENEQARIRGTILMAYSNTFGAILLSTGNKSEISVGYCTLYGDTNGGLCVPGDLYKTEVFDMCHDINVQAGYHRVPSAICTKPPSAELAPGQKDTDSLPPYETLDPILKWHIEGSRLIPVEWKSARTFVEDLIEREDGRATVNRIIGLVARNEYKRRQGPPIVRLRARAFGSGRQMPLSAKYDSLGV